MIFHNPNDKGNKMNASIKEAKEEKKFKPLILKIRIESMNELCGLYHLFNTHFSMISDNMFDPIFPCPDKLNKRAVWEEIKIKLEELTG